MRIFDAGNGGRCGDFQGEFEGAGSLRSSADRAVTRSTGTPASDAEVLTAVDENSVADHDVVAIDFGHFGTSAAVALGYRHVNSR